MFTLISYKLNVKGETYQMHQVHMSFETPMALDRLGNDSRVSDLQRPIEFDTLEAAQAKQKELRNA